MRADLMRLPMPFGETLDARTSWRVTQEENMHTFRRLGSRPQIWKANPALLTRTTRSSSVCNKPRRMARFYSPSFCLTLSTLPTSTKPWHTKPSVCISVQWYHDFKLLRTSWDFSIHCLAASGALQLPRPVTHELSKHLSRSGRRPFLLPSRSSRALCQKPSVAALRASLP